MKPPLQISLNEVFSQNYILVVINENTLKWLVMPRLPIIVNIINGENLQENQRKAILVLIHKDGEPNVLKNWRPISLICTDVKIVAKILARRLKSKMNEIISHNQYCV